MSKKQDTGRGKYLLKNTAIFAIGNFGTKLISFVLVPLYTYALTAQEYGTVDLIAAIAFIAAPLLSLNIAEAVMRFSLDEDADQAQILSVGVGVCGVAIVVAALSLLIMWSIPAISEYAFHTYLYIVSSMASQIFLYNLRGREMLLQYSVGNILNTFLAASLNVVFLVVCDWGIKGYLLAYILAYTVTTVYALLQKPVRADFRRFSLNKKLAGEMIKYSVVLVPTALMWWIMSSLDKVMLSFMSGLAVAGLYAVSYKLPTIASTISTIFNQAWSYSAIREEDSTDRDDYSNTIYNGVVAVSLLVGAGLLLILRDFMKIYVAEEYYSAWEYTPPLIVGTVFLSIGTFVATPYTVHKDSLGYLKSGMMGAGTNVALNFALIPFFGAVGAAIATCISYVVTYIYRMADTRKYVKLNIMHGNHIAGFALLVISAVTVYLEGILSRLLPLAALIEILILFRKVWGGLLNGLLKKIKGRKKNALE